MTIADLMDDPHLRPVCFPSLDIPYHGIFLVGNNVECLDRLLLLLYYYALLSPIARWLVQRVRKVGGGGGRGGSRKEED